MQSPRNKYWAIMLGPSQNRTKMKV